VEGEDTDPEDGEYIEDEAREESSDDGLDTEQGELGWEMNLGLPARPRLIGIGMIVLLASTSSMVSWNIFSFSLMGLNGDLGDRGEKFLRGEVIVTDNVTN